MSRITLAVMVCFVLARTAAPCCAELFSVAVPDLEGNYGGFGGEGHESAFDFGQGFMVVNEAWVHVVGFSDIFPPGSASALQCFGFLDGVTGPSLELAAEVAFDANVPLTPPATVLDGNGTVSLTINVLECCDHIASVTAATLWFDVETITICGDGTIDPGEECDDGNTNSGDGCSSLCEVELPVAGIPTVSTWSLIVLTMLGMTAGTIMLGRHRRPAAA